MLDFPTICCHTKSMNNEQLTDAMIEYIEERQWEEWEAWMNEEPPYKLSTDA